MTRRRDEAIHYAALVRRWPIMAALIAVCGVVGGAPTVSEATSTISTFVELVQAEMPDSHERRQTANVPSIQFCPPLFAGHRRQTCSSYCGVSLSQTSSGLSKGGKNRDDASIIAQTVAEKRKADQLGPIGSLASPTAAMKAHAGLSRNCALPSYPDSSCTGVPTGMTLTPVNGDVTVNTANTKIEGKDIRGCVLVRAPGVIIRNSKAFCINSIGYTGAWLIIEDSEIDCRNRRGSTAVGEENVIIRRSNIHSCENGFDVNRNFTIEDNYIHDLYQGNGSDDPHTDGVQMWGTAANVIIRHNRIYAGNGTSAIISPRSGMLGTVIKDNLLAGGAYTLYCRAKGAGGQRIIDNHFSTIFFPSVGAFGPWTECEDEAEITGNVYHETGLPLPGQNSVPASILSDQR